MVDSREHRASIDSVPKSARVLVIRYEHRTGVRALTYFSEHAALARMQRFRDEGTRAALFHSKINNWERA